MLHEQARENAVMRLRVSGGIMARSLKSILEFHYWVAAWSPHATQESLADH